MLALAALCLGLQYSRQLHPMHTRPRIASLQHSGPRGVPAHALDMKAVTPDGPQWAVARQLNKVIAHHPLGFELKSSFDCTWCRQPSGLLPALLSLRSSSVMTLQALIFVLAWWSRVLVQLHSRSSLLKRDHRARCFRIPECPRRTP